MGDVAGRARVYERRLSFEGLHEVGQQRTAQQRHHRADGADVSGARRLPVARVADRRSVEATAQVVVAGGERYLGHDLGRVREVEPRIADGAIGGAAQAGRDLPQRGVRDGRNAAPDDAAGRKAGDLAALDGVLCEGREQVMRGGDGVRVPGEVESDVALRHDARAASARPAAVRPEDGAERRFGERRRCFVAELGERLDEADGDGRLALARRRGRDAGHDDEFAVGRAGAHGVQRDLGDVVAIQRKAPRLDAQRSGDCADRLHDCL